MPGAEALLLLEVVVKQDYIFFAGQLLLVCDRKNKPSWVRLDNFYRR